LAGRGGKEEEEDQEDFYQLLSRVPLSIDNYLQEHASSTLMPGNRARTEKWSARNFHVT
jgi:hypothetical protein